MDNNQIIKELGSLMQLDYDAVQAYDQALEKIDDASVKSELSLYRDDHRRHVDDLSQAITSLGGTPPSRSADFKGFMIKGMTAARSMTGTKGALEAMQTNEKLTNKSYGDAAAMDFPASIKALIDRNYADEKRHLAYINKQLSLVGAR